MHNLYKRYPTPTETGSLIYPKAKAKAKANLEKSRFLNAVFYCISPSKTLAAI